MNEALVDIRRKVERANGLFDQVKAEFGLGPEAEKPAVYPSGIHYEPTWTHIELKTDFPLVQREVGLILGDALHQMRSSLDHVVSYLVFQETRDRAAMRKAQFPVLHDRAEFLNFRKHRRVKFLADTFGDPSKIFTAIQDAQPYSRKPGAPKNDGLWVLSGLDNIDKHRTILVLHNTISIEGVVYSADSCFQSRFKFPKYPVTGDTQEMHFDWPHPVPPMAVNIERISPWFVFQDTDGLCDKLSIFPLFGRMREAVTETIALFEPFFAHVASTPEIRSQ